MGEVDVRQDTIYLDDNSRAISESRLTGWQSDIGENELLYPIHYRSYLGECNKLLVIEAEFCIQKFVVQTCP